MTSREFLEYYFIHIGYRGPESSFLLKWPSFFLGKEETFEAEFDRPEGA